MGAPKQPLGQILLQMGLLDPEQLQVALSHHQQWGVPLGRAVQEKRFCTPEQVLQALSRQTGLPAVDLDRQRMDPFLAPLIPRKVAEQHRAVPLKVEGKRAENLVIAIAAPASLASLDALQAVSRKSRIVAQLAADDAMARAIDRLYGGDPAPLEPPRPAEPADAAGGDLLHNARMLDLGGGAPAAPKPPAPLPASAAIDAILGPPPSATTSAAIDAILGPPPPAPVDPWSGDRWADLDLTPATRALIDQAAQKRGESRKATVAAILEAYAAFKKR